MNKSYYETNIGYVLEEELNEVMIKHPDLTFKTRKGDYVIIDNIKEIDEIC